MDLQELQWNWNELGKTDPLFAILTVPSKSSNRWDRDEFFKSGETEIQSVISYLSSLSRITEYGKALDFGCGVGRLTQALCNYFQQCDGVDIAPSMISAACGFNKYGNRCRYHLNKTDDLGLFADDQFDFIYSLIVLQHIEPRFAVRYIEEFIRVLKPGGLALFQIPSRLNQDASEPLDDESCSAIITVISTPKEMIAGSQVILKVRVQNASPKAWAASKNTHIRYPVRLGNHWLQPDGTVYQWDDLRAALPRDLPPCEETELELPVTAPAKPGNYVLELDMVRQIFWFNQNGSRTLRLPVKVLQTPISTDIKPSAPPGNKQARMEMHCIPRDEVLRVVTSIGGLVVDVKEDFWADGCEGYRYCVTKKKLAKG